MTNLAWVDLETTGLNPRQDEILEIGIVVTDNDLQERSAVQFLMNPWGPQLEAGIQACDPFIIDMHNASGLFDDLRDDKKHKFNCWDGLIESLIADFLSDHDAVGSPMCGSTVHFDRNFLNQHLRKVEALFHYRNIDVSTVKQLYNIELERDMVQNPRLSIEEGDFPLWKGSDPKPHRALDDIRESIAELKFYREHLFR